MKQFIVLAFLFSNLIGQLTGDDGAFYVLHFHGKCVGGNSTVVLKEFCRKKYRWKGGVRLFDLSNDECIGPKDNTAVAGTLLKMTLQCSGTDSLFRFDERTNSIRHLISGLCVQTDGSPSVPAENANLQLGQCKQSDNEKFWLIPRIMYTIRHHSGLCLHHSTGDNLFKLQSRQICDRFMFDGIFMKLLHVKTRKYLCEASSFMQAEGTCDAHDSLSYYSPDSFSLKSDAPTRCLQPAGGLLSPVVGTKLILGPCSSEARFHFKLYDERYNLKVKLAATAYNDYTDGTSPGNVKNDIYVNGFQYSMNGRGINLALFDYRSGLFEHKKTFDIFLDSETARSELANYLNSLPDGKVVFMVTKDAVKMSTTLATALQKFGISATFASSPIGTYGKSMVNIAFSGRQRKSWERSINKLGGTGGSFLNTEVKLFQESGSHGCCSEELGLRTGEISDSQLSSPSQFNTNHPPKDGRLHNDATDWCSAKNKPLDYWQVDLGSVRGITGIATQGHKSYHTYGVSKYNLAYSTDGFNWKFYTDEFNNKKSFDGNIKILHSVKVNWFSRIVARFLRVHPTERFFGYSCYCNCMRIELFGCFLKGPITLNTIPVSQQKIAGRAEGTLSFYGFAQKGKQISVEISTADATSLGVKTDQLHFYRVNQTAKSHNGTILQDTVSIKKISDTTRNMKTSVAVEYSIPHNGYYNSDLGIGARVLDRGTAFSKDAWHVFSYETDAQMLIAGYKWEVARQLKDQSQLVFKINSTKKEHFERGDVMSLNITISQLLEKNARSHSNAYNIELFLYYDTQFLDFETGQSLNSEEFIIPPTENSSRPGLQYFSTHTLWLLNFQKINLLFRFKSPSAILKGERHKGDIILDFRYCSNLKKFNGTVNTELNRTIPYALKVMPKVESMGPATRLHVPQFSMLYDQVNKDMYVCKRKSSYQHFKQSCYKQATDSRVWTALPFIVSVAGVDEYERNPIGIDALGSGYYQLLNNLSFVGQIDDNEWTSIQNQPHIRKALTSSDVTSLPTAPANAWMMPAPPHEIWAATNRWVMKKIAGVWTKVFQLYN